MELTPNFDIPIPSDPMNQRQVRAEALAIDAVLFDLEGDITALPDGSGTTNKLTFWSDGDTIDDTAIHYSGGKLGFGGVTSPAAWIDVLPATNEKVLKASIASGILAPFSFWHTEDSLAGPFGMVISSGATSVSRRDTAMAFGLNPQREAGTDEISLTWTIEPWASGTPNEQLEVYWEYINDDNDAGAVLLRPLSMTIRHDIHNVLTDFFTTSFKIWAWPYTYNGGVQPDHAAITFAYPNLTVNDGELILAGNESTGEFGLMVGDATEYMIRRDLASAKITVGDNVSSLFIKGDVGINTDGPDSSARVIVQGTATGQTSFRIIPTFAGTQTAPLVDIKATDGSNLFQLTMSGQFVSGPGASGGALDVGLLRSGTNKWKVTNASSGYGSMEMDSLTATGFVEATTGVLPVTNDGAALGSTTKQWSDLFLAEGGVINWDNGDVTITQTGNVLTFAGAATRYEFDASLTPVSSDGSALGSTALMFSDLFLASGGVINFNNGDVTLTHAANLLSIAGGDLAHAENIRMNGASAQAWTNGKSMYGPNSGFLFGDAGDFHFTSNCMVDSTAANGWRYIATGPAANLYLYNGHVVARIIGSGSAGANLDWSTGTSTTII